MRLAIFSPLTALAGLFAGLVATLLAPAPAMAQVEPTFENAITCALIYRYLGDRGPAYDRLVARSAELSGRSEASIRIELDEREPRLIAGIADGRLEAASMEGLGAKACPRTFGVAPATRGAQVRAAGSGQPDPLRCAGLARWFDRKFPSNSWGTTWAGDEMVRRSASAAGLDYGAMDSRAGGFSPGLTPVPALLDEAVRCQNAYDTPVPPGAVLAAVQHGDRPGIERGRNHYCQALANDFDKGYPDVASFERAILRHPPSGLEQTSKVMENLLWPLKQMEKAQCPAFIAQSRVDAFTDFTTRATAAAKQAQARLEREGKWW
ncbi:MAG: hypothetical protein ACK4YM_04920 [Novosphingobium sp.]